MHYAVLGRNREKQQEVAPLAVSYFVALFVRIALDANPARAVGDRSAVEPRANKKQ